MLSEATVDFTAQLHNPDSAGSEAFPEGSFARRAGPDCLTPAGLGRIAGEEELLQFPWGYIYHLPFLTDLIPPCSSKQLRQLDN